MATVFIVLLCAFAIIALALWRKRETRFDRRAKAAPTAGPAATAANGNGLAAPPSGRLPVCL